MSTKLQLLALAAGLLLPAAAFAGTPDTANPSAGYLTIPDAPMVAPNDATTGSSGSTIRRQQESGYFPTADAPMVAPDTVPGDASQTLPRQRASGYFPSADAPMVAPASSYR